MATKKERLIANLQQANSDELKEWIISEIDESVEESDITEGSDNGYVDGKHHINPVEDFYIAMMVRMFPNFKK